MAYKEQLLEADGKKYTVMDFCEHYGFKYTSVKYHLRKGKSGDEIVAALRQNSLKRRYSSAPGRGKTITVNHVQYRSVVEAAGAYGIPSHRVYTLSKEKKISHEAAINELVKNQAGHVTPCTIAGVNYPSREAAARAYELPMQTIRARMARRGLTFEEAILNGSRERSLMIPEKSKWNGLNLAPIETPESDKSMLYFLSSVLSSNNYPVKCFCDQEKSVWAVRIQESMDVGGELIDIYILFNENDLGRDLEIIMPAVGKIKSLTSKERKTLLEQFNSLNNAYTGARISLDENRMVISWSAVLGRTKISATALIRMIYRFMGTAGVLWKETCWAAQR